MNLNDVLKKRMDEYGFIELKAPLAIADGKGEIPVDLPLPVRTKAMAGWVKSGEDAEIRLENLVEDLAMVMGIDETFPHFQSYHQLLDWLTQGQVKAAIEQYVARCYEKQAPDDAMILMRTLRFLYPEDANVHFSYAIAVEMFAQKRLQEGAKRACDYLYGIAAEEYRRLLEKHPHFTSVMYKLGYYYLYMNQYQASQTQFIKYLETVGDDEESLEMRQEVQETLQKIEPYCLYEEAAAYVQAQQFEEAIMLLERLLDRNSEWWQAELLLGISLRGVSRLSDAVGHLERAAALQDQEPMVFFELAQTQYLLRHYEEAYEAIQKTIGLDREWSDGYLVRAQITRAMGRREEAMQDLKTCMQLAPQDAAAQQLLRQWEQDS